MGNSISQCLAPCWFGLAICCCRSFLPKGLAGGCLSLWCSYLKLACFFLWVTSGSRACSLSYFLGIGMTSHNVRISTILVGGSILGLPSLASVSAVFSHGRCFNRHEGAVLYVCRLKQRVGIRFCLRSLPDKRDWLIIQQRLHR